MDAAACGVLSAQVWNTDDPEDEPLAMVVRTGYNTTVGAMARQLLAPTRLPQIDPFVEVRPALPLSLLPCPFPSCCCRPWLLEHHWRSPLGI